MHSARTLSPILAVAGVTLLGCLAAGPQVAIDGVPPPIAAAPAALDSPPPVDDARVDAPAACDRPFPVAPTPPAQPPFSGTAFLDPGLITDADPTALTSLTFTGQAVRQMFDRRTNSFNDVDAYLFDARFGTTVTVEVQVDPEFTRAEAEAEARFYATAAGRLPAFVFLDLRTMWIHKGRFPFGGGNNNLLVHTEQGREYAAGGVLEEIFLHEGTHTSLDGHHAATARWREAQRADGVAISTYARDNLAREDLAETLGPYLAQRLWAARLPAATVAAIRAAIPSRIAYLDCLALDLAPVP